LERRTAINLGGALLSAGLLIATFPGFDLSWLAPFALTPLLFAAAREWSPWRRFLIGEAAGIVYWFGVCHWIQFVLARHGDMGELGGWGSFLLFCVLKGLHLGLFTLLAGYVMEKPYAVPAVAALWVGIERTHGPLGFAWMALGNAGIDMTLPMRLAPWLGVYGLSFVFAMLAAALTLMALRRPRRELVWLLVLPGLLVLPELPEVSPPQETAVVAQPNIDLERRWSRGDIDSTVERLSLRSMTAALEAGTVKPRMILWPEVPAPFYYESDPRFREAAHKLARVTRTSFLFGTVAYTADGSPLNSAQLVSPAGEPVVRYDKIKLVPFGEFIPPLFGFVNRITSEAGDFAAGQDVVLMPIEGRQAGVFICYESVFPDLVRRFAGRGAEVFVNLSNDGYFGRSAARYQHLLIARMRAAENRRWIIRATNNGVTVAIDPAGRVRQRLVEEEELAARLGFSYESGTTFYTRYGDWFAWLCLLGGLAAVLLSQVPEYNPEP
jgi:apolipoprotein N-acyltransferase